MSDQTVPEASSMLDFSAFIAERTRDFTGREWATQRIEAWLNTPDAAPLFVITGEPGAGKSAFAARLVQSGKTQAFHFCIARQAATLDPLTFTRHVSHQLTHLEGFAAHLLEEARVHLNLSIDVGANYGHITAVQIENLIVKAPSAAEAFNRTVADPLKNFCAEKPSEKALILVDGLDEADEHPGPVKIADLLANTGGLPPQVRFIITARPDGAGLRQVSGLPHTGLDLINDEQEHFGDANRYALKQLDASPALRELLRRQGKSAASFLRELEPKHQGNFRYLSLLFAAIERGEEWTEDLERLPPGLDGIYREHLRTRAVGKQSLWRAYRPVLGVLAAAQEALSVEQIEQFSRVASQKVWDVLQDAGQFIEKTSAPPFEYRLYHQSLADFLGDQNRAQEYWIDLKAVHQKISKSYAGFLKSRNWEGCDTYGLEHLAVHLYRGGLYDSLYTLVDEGRMHARLQDEQYQYTGWLSEAGLAWKAARQPDQTSAPAQLSAQRAGVQVRCALSQASVRSLASNTTPELLRRLVAGGLWELDRALSLAGQISEGTLQRRCLCALLKIDSLDQEQKSKLAGLLQSNGWEAACEDEGEAAEQIPGFPFQLDSISPQGRSRLEQTLEETLKDPLPSPPPGFGKKNPLMKILEEELAPRAMDEMARRVWFFQRLGVTPSPQPSVAQRAQDEAAAALALSLALTPHLANRYFEETFTWVNRLRDPARKATGLWALAPYVTETNESEMLEAVDNLPPGELSLPVIDRLAASLSTPGVKKIAAGLLAIREDETGRMLLLARLVPQLKDKDLKQTALGRALSLADSRRGPDSELGTRVYADLAKFLSPEGIESAIARSQGLSYLNSGSLARLMPFVGAGRQTELATEAVSKPLEYEMESYHGPALVQLGGYLSAEKLKDSLAFHGFTNREDTQALLERIDAAANPDERSAACVEPLLEIAFKYFGETFLDCLVTLLPHIKETNLPKALSLVEGYNDPLDQERARLLLATKMPVREREPYVSRIMETALAEGEDTRATLIGMAAEYHPEWFQAHAGEYSSAAQEPLGSAAQTGRAAVLEGLCQLLHAWLLLGGRGTAEEIFRAVLQVCEEWEWM